jgi:hypothetical protein
VTRGFDSCALVKQSRHCTSVGLVRGSEDTLIESPLQSWLLVPLPLAHSEPYLTFGLMDVQVVELLVWGRHP